MGVGGGGPGLASVGVEGAERLVELVEDGEAASSQLSASDGLGFAEVEMASFLREESSPWWLSASLNGFHCESFTRRSTRCGRHCGFQGKKSKPLAFSKIKMLILGNQCKEAVVHR